MSNLNINQFKQTPVRGQLDLQIQKSGIIQGQVSTNQATSLKAGDFVKLDTAVTTGQFPSFIIASNSADSTMFCIAQNVKKNTFVSFDVIDVTFFGGPVMWMTVTGVVACGSLVESVSGLTGANVQVQSSNKIRGILLDPSPATGTLCRVIILNVAQG